jgi:hypothetical protein
MSTKALDPKTAAFVLISAEPGNEKMRATPDRPEAVEINVTELKARRESFMKRIAADTASIAEIDALIAEFTKLRK